MDCKIIKEICADPREGTYGVCRSCEYSTMNTPPVMVRLSKRDYSFVMDLCDELTMESAVTELVMQGIRSIRRHVKKGA